MNKRRIIRAGGVDQPRREVVLQGDRLTIYSRGTCIIAMRLDPLDLAEEAAANAESWEADRDR